MTRLPRVDRRMWLIAGVLAGLVLCGPAARAGQVRLLDLENRPVDPLAIRDHLVSFGYPMRALRDPAHALAKLVRATVTPEAVVVVGDRIVYRGRIDDRYVELGVQRPAPTRRDLEDALTAVLAGKAVQPQTTQAVGCVIADLLR